MTRIFIENFELDIDKELSNQITYAIDDIRNLDSKATAFTKTIVLPGTTNNNNLLGSIFEINNSNFTNDNLANVKYNFNAAKTAKCRIDVNGMKMIKGVFRLLEIIIDGKLIEYECSVIGELGGFVTKLGAKQINELNFSAYDHEYSIANIVASWDNANAGQGYYYPLVDIGAVSTGTYGTYKVDYQYRAFRPALFVKEYIDKIFEAAGYTYDCDLFNTDRFKRLIIPYNRKFLTTNSSTSLSADGGEVYLYSDTSPYENVDFIGGTIVLGFFTTDVNGSVFTYTQPANQPFTISFNIHGRVEGIGGVSQSVNVYLKKNGIIIQTQTIPSQLGNYGSVDYSLDFTQVVSLTTGDYFEIAVESINNLDYLEGFVTNLLVSTTSDIPVQIGLGDDVIMNDTIAANVLQKDFFVSILKLFNLYVDEDQFTEKLLVIKPYVDYYTTSEDWSDKVDRGKPIRLKPMSELNARYYDFKFKGDTDYWNDLYKKRYNEGYGDRRFDSAYEFSNDTQSLEVIFSSTPLVGYVGLDKIVPTIFKMNNAIEEQIDCNIRIMVAKKVTGVSSWLIMNAGATLGTYTDYPYAGHLDDPDAPANDLNFGVPRELFFALVSGDLTVNQFNVYYSSYIAEITDKDSRLLTCDLKLTDADVYGLDFRKYKYIDGGLWRLTKLTDFTPEANQPTRAELLRVIYTIY